MLKDFPNEQEQQEIVNDHGIAIVVKYYLNIEDKMIIIMNGWDRIYRPLTKHHCQIARQFMDQNLVVFAKEYIKYYTDKGYQVSSSNKDGEDDWYVFDFVYNLNPTLITSIILGYDKHFKYHDTVFPNLKNVYYTQFWSEIEPEIVSFAKLNDIEHLEVVLANPRVTKQQLVFKSVNTVEFHDNGNSKIYDTKESMLMGNITATLTFA